MPRPPIQPPIHPLRRWRAAAALLLIGLFGAGAHAALDTTALTDDHSINVPTAWSTYTDLTPQELADRLAPGLSRIVGLDVTGVTGSGEPRFTARLVSNSGAYAVPAWWWYYDQTPEQITALLNANTGRLIELERYDRGGGQIRYAVVMVSNQGAAARRWSYLLNVTAAQLGQHIQRTNSRPIDLDMVGSGSTRRLNAILVANTGADYKPFDWRLDQTPAGIVGWTTNFNGRVVKLSRQSDGKYLFIQVRNSGADASAWWHKYGFASMTELRNYADQMVARPVDVTSRLVNGVRRFDAALIDNANAEERRMRGLFAGRFIDANQNPRGIFSAYLKQVRGPVLVDLNGQRSAETASSLKVLHLLHSLRQVQAGRDYLSANDFAYFDYYDGSNNVPKDRCPHPAQELGAETSWTYDDPRYSTLEWGLDRMMGDSDNRTTRGVVLRYGGSFAPFNATAAWAGLTGTKLQHDIGCAYYDTVAKIYAPEQRRNLTTAADLARIYEGVHTGQLLTATNRARNEFLESTFRANPTGGAVRHIINHEAAVLGKSAFTSEFADLVRRWGKTGNYGTCLPLAGDNTQCGQSVIVNSSAGLLRLPIKSGPYLAFVYFSYGSLISDVPVDSDTTADLDSEAYGDAKAELFRSVIREALATW